MRGSSDSRTLVHRAIAMGDLIVACELLRGGARLEARDKRRLCALDEVAARHDLHPVSQSSAIIACLATRSQFSALVFLFNSWCVGGRAGVANSCAIH